MSYRNVRFDDIEELSNHIAGDEDLGLKLMSWIKCGLTKYEWCFLEEDNHIKNIVIYGCAGDQIIILYLASFEGNQDLSLLCNFLNDSLNHMKSYELIPIYYYLYSDNKLFKEYLDLFGKLGFKKVQHKKSYLFEGDVNHVNYNRLYYKTLSDAGENNFIEAIRAVSENTLDGVDRNDILENGAEEAARRYFEALKSLDYNEAWWKLAYDENHDFAGLIVPQKLNDSVGAINYIGVVPQKRGHKFSRDLLYEGLSILKSCNINQIIADIDEGNDPLEQALLELNFALSCSVVVLKSA